MARTALNNITLNIYSLSHDHQPPFRSWPVPIGPGKLAAPVLSVGTPGSTSIPLSWTFTDDGQTGFEIERSPNGTDSWVSQTSAGSASRSATASGLTAETDYWFRIRAVDSGAPSRNSNWSNVVTGRTAVAPAPGAGFTANFDAEAGSVGQLVQSAGGVLNGAAVFTSDASRTTYTDIESYSGYKSIRTAVEQGSTGFGQLGGVYTFSSAGRDNLVKGDEIWVRLRMKLGSTWQWNSGRNKFLRYRVYSSSGESRGYNDLYFDGNRSDGGVYSFIFEGEHNWYHFQGPLTDLPSKSGWKTIEFYMKLDDKNGSEGGDSMIRLWLDGVLIGESAQRRTLVSDTDVVRYFSLFT